MRLDASQGRQVLVELTGVVPSRNDQAAESGLGNLTGQIQPIVATEAGLLLFLQALIKGIKTLCH